MLREREKGHADDEKTLTDYIKELNDFLRDAESELEQLKAQKSKPKPAPKKSEERPKESAPTVGDDETITVSVVLEDHTNKKLSVKKSEDWVKAVKEFTKENNINKEGEDSIMSELEAIFGKKQ